MVTITYRDIIAANFPEQLIDSEISVFNSYDVEELLTEASIYARQKLGENQTPIERLMAFSEFIGRTFTYDARMWRASFIEAIRARTGTCTQFAGALLIIAMKDESLFKAVSRIRSLELTVTIGNIPYEGHVVVVAEINGKKLLLDPTNSVAGSYSDFSIVEKPFAPVLEKLSGFGDTKLYRVKIEKVITWDWLKDGLIKIENPAIKEAVLALSKKLEPKYKRLESLLNEMEGKDLTEETFYRLERERLSTVKEIDTISKELRLLLRTDEHALVQVL